MLKYLFPNMTRQTGESVL